MGLGIVDEYRQWLSGALPSIVRMGLGAGLRDIEMTWFTWDWTDWRHGAVRIEKTICDVNGREWLPKTHEARAIDVESEFIDYMKMEQKRQQELGLLNQFVIPAGGRNMTTDRCKLSWNQVETIRKAFADGAKRAQLASTHTPFGNIRPQPEPQHGHRGWVLFGAAWYCPRTEGAR
jgi:hypothetical protein